MQIDRLMYEEWIEHPVTKEYLAVMRSNIESTTEDLISGKFLDDQIKQSRMVGHLDILNAYGTDKMTGIIFDIIPEKK